MGREKERLALKIAPRSSLLFSISQIWASTIVPQGTGSFLTLAGAGAGAGAGAAVGCGSGAGV